MNALDKAVKSAHAVTDALTELQQALNLLESLNFKVLEPLVARDVFAVNTDNQPVLRVAIADTESTGLDPANDKLIELGMIKVEVSRATGQAYRVLGRYNALEDPGRPIPEDVSRINGITDEMVAGHRFDDKELEAFVADVDLVICHNSNFDRRLLEGRFPFFEAKAFACSLHQVDWKAGGIGSQKLDYIAAMLGFHYEAHRAITDCEALLEALQRPMPATGDIGMQELLMFAFEPDFSIAALRAPFDAKGLLKARGYRWTDNGVDKYWSTEVGKLQYDDEIAWLGANVYCKPKFQLGIAERDAYTRFSDRAPRLTVDFPAAA
ncbi:3'-5' exonuclease [Paraburkholderia sp. UCT31]|uniref:3'-5' exonuclease n=1 Tax=Paraburkholderia sp. UCT31 TaxID=2615209 RepID=UPI00165587F3|nr:3'-5' exonuclease [Paraburkholderia sp. UCT31]